MTPFRFINRATGELFTATGTDLVEVAFPTDTPPLEHLEFQKRHYDHPPTDGALAELLEERAAIARFVKTHWAKVPWNCAYHDPVLADVSVGAGWYSKRDIPDTEVTMVIATGIIPSPFRDTFPEVSGKIHIGVAIWTEGVDYPFVWTPKARVTLCVIEPE